MFVVNIKSGFGNQLFQYNFAKYLQKKYPGTDIVFNTSWFKTDAIHGGYMLGNTEFNINNHVYKKIKKIVTDETYDSFKADDEDVFFDGYWQNLKFFNEQNLTIEGIFRQSLNDNNQKWLNQINNSKNSVSIHVRCGDYNNHFLMGNIATKTYFNNAIQKILKLVKEPEFFVFSDDLEWAKKNLDFNGKKVSFITGNEKAEDNKWDIFLMSHCKYNILSNSSFSWWGHYLNNNKGKKAIIPEYWINEIADSFPAVVSSLQSLKTEIKVKNFPEVTKENKKPLFTIILTAYNQENCIRRAVSSILNQTFQDFELIVVDDCSTDNTPKVLSEYSKLNKKIRIIRQKMNASSHQARMTGVKNARGKYILFLDGDDFFYIDALERLNAEVIQKKNFDACEFAYVIRPKNEMRLSQVWDNTKARIEYYNSVEPLVNVWNKLYSAELLKKAFKAMKEGYIRTGDDTYESICIAAFTQNYIQADIPVVNYLKEGGISFKLNTYESNLIHAKSLSLSLQYLKDFLFENTITDKPDFNNQLFNQIEENCYRWFVSVIKNNTEEKDVVRSLQLLPQFFDFKFCEPYLNKIYAPYLRKKNIKKLIKKLLPENLKRCIKKILKK